MHLSTSNLSQLTWLQVVTGAFAGLLLSNPLITSSPALPKYPTINAQATAYSQ